TKSDIAWQSQTCRARCTVAEIVAGTRDERGGGAIYRFNLFERTSEAGVLFLFMYLIQRQIGNLPARNLILTGFLYFVTGKA
ncbi:MAG TPA: hypothetical protein VFT90_06600, partial [Chryseosolibacter sp.]|nr:hypothetical protein [Chryseosolibacter sp.]